MQLKARAAQKTLAARAQARAAQKSSIARNQTESSADAELSVWESWETRQGLCEDGGSRPHTKEVGGQVLSYQIVRQIARIFEQYFQMAFPGLGRNLLNEFLAFAGRFRRYAQRPELGFVTTNILF